MTSRYEPYREMWRLFSRPVFLLTDFLGVVGLSVSKLAADPWSGALAAVGSALLAIGFSLPVALFYQLRANAESLKILDTCNRAGIRAIFKSRQADSEELREAIDTAAARSSEIKLMGVAFRSIFNPSGEHTRQFRERLDDPRIPLRILLLNPDSDAAKRRAVIEQGNTTIEDIRFTINHGIPSTIQERLKRGDDSISEGLQQATKATLGADCNQKEISACNLQVHLYDIDPIALLMIFQESVFTEQYHLGRPKALRSGSCIGKYVPVIEYSSSADACSFLIRHFEEIWNLSKDITEDVLKLAVHKTQNMREGVT
ncbi:MAG: hypothetical protein A3J94_00635 [Syntrophus sp. RIFOXYC2_FULL_54_9]|nr:MAG: hypothetical protein A3J94_00635 [Syntrophus sp. RIFOXYC2_FULL_54_9]